MPKEGCTAIVRAGYYIVNFQFVSINSARSKNFIQMNETVCVIGCSISSTLPYLCNKVKENWMKWLQKLVFSNSPTAWTAQQEKKSEDVSPIFSFAYWETDVKGFTLLIFQPAGVVAILLTGREITMKKINSYISTLLSRRLS